MKAMRGPRLLMLLALTACGGAAAGPTSTQPEEPAAKAPPEVASTAGPATSAAVPPEEEPAAAASAEVAPTYVPLTEERVREVVRGHYDRVGACYGAGLERVPGLAGTIEVHLSIGGDGSVISAFADKDEPTKGKRAARKPPPRRRPKRAEDQRITDPEVVRCVEAVFTSLTFPPTGRGMVNLVYPVVLRSE